MKTFFSRLSLYTLLTFVSFSSFSQDDLVYRKIALNVCKDIKKQGLYYVDNNKFNEILSNQSNKISGTSGSAANDLSKIIPAMNEFCIAEIKYSEFHNAYYEKSSIASNTPKASASNDKVIKSDTKTIVDTTKTSTKENEDSKYAIVYKNKSYETGIKYYSLKPIKTVDAEISGKFMEIQKGAMYSIKLLHNNKVYDFLFMEAENAELLNFFNNLKPNDNVNVKYKILHYRIKEKSKIWLRNILVEAKKED